MYISRDLEAEKNIDPPWPASCWSRDHLHGPRPRPGCPTEVAKPYQTWSYHGHFYRKNMEKSWEMGYEWNDECHQKYGDFYGLLMELYDL